MERQTRQRANREDVLHVEESRICFRYHRHLVRDSRTLKCPRIQTQRLC